MQHIMRKEEEINNNKGYVCKAPVIESAFYHTEANCKLRQRHDNAVIYVIL